MASYDQLCVVLAIKLATVEAMTQFYAISRPSRRSNDGPARVI